MGLYDFTFYDLINRNAVSFGRKTAWVEVDDDRTVTFSAFKQSVDRLAQGLKKAGIAKGSRLGVLGKNSLEYFLLFGAAAAVGALVLPSNWRLSAEDVCFFLKDCEPTALYVDHEAQEHLDGTRQKVPPVRALNNPTSDAGGCSTFTTLTDHGETFDPEAVPVGADDGLVIIHTAAVAGRPRGALLSHSNVLCADMHLSYLFNLDADDVHLNLLPLFHVGGLFMVTGSFHAGVPSVNMSKFDAEKAVELIESKKITVMFDLSLIHISEPTRL